MEGAENQEEERGVASCLLSVELILRSQGTQTIVAL